MKLKLFFTLCLALFLSIGTQSCRKGPTKTHRGKIKKGKPIPCPIKDC